MLTPLNILINQLKKWLNLMSQNLNNLNNNVNFKTKIFKIKMNLKSVFPYLYFLNNSNLIKLKIIMKIGLIVKMN